MKTNKNILPEYYATIKYFRDIQMIYDSNECNEKYFKSCSKKLIEIYKLNDLVRKDLIKESKDKDIINKANKVELAEKIIYHNCIIIHFINILVVYLNKIEDCKINDVYNISSNYTIKDVERKNKINEKAELYFKSNVADSNILDDMSTFVEYESREFRSLHGMSKYNPNDSDFDFIFQNQLDEKKRSEWLFLFDDLFKLRKLLKAEFDIKNNTPKLDLDYARSLTIDQLYRYLYSEYCNLLVVANYIENPVLYKILFDSNYINNFDI